MKEDPQARSNIMRAVKAQDTSPELLVRSLVHKMGFRYRLYASGLPGKPDIVFRKLKKVIFVHGCFWHGHKCKRGNRIPKTNRRYWKEKISRNITRDKEHLTALRKMGWASLVIWECQMKDEGKLARRIKKFLD